ncbi:MAG: caspase family protein [Promethearchaeota archaeon]
MNHTGHFRFILLFSVLLHLSLLDSNPFDSSNIDISLPNAQDDENPIEKFAIIIGASFYIDIDGPVYGISDAIDINDLFINEFKIPESNILCLKNILNLSKSDILDSILTFDSEMDDNDYLFFYFSGKGKKSNNIYKIYTTILLFEEFFDQEITPWELNSEFKNVTGKVICIIDADYSWGFVQYLDDKYVDCIVASCSIDEHRTDDFQVNNSVFTDNFIQLWNGNEKLTFEDIFGELQVNTYNRAYQFGEIQIPRFLNNLNVELNFYWEGRNPYIPPPPPPRPPPPLPSPFPILSWIIFVLLVVVVFTGTFKYRRWERENRNH